MAYDYIIVGGGSAGSVMANRLSAKSANNVLLCEAGQDTPDGKVPPEILNSYPGTAYFDPRFHWQELKVHTEIVPHNRPDERPPLRKYEQARVLGGGSSINGQLANRGAPTDYDEWEAKGAAGLELERGAALFQKGRARHGFRRPVSRQGRPHPGAPHLSRYVVRPCQGRRAAFKEAGYDYIEDQNGEFRDGYFPITISNLYDRRVSAAIGYLDSETRRRAEPDDLGRDAGRRAAVRGHAMRRGQGAGARERRPSSASIRTAARSSSRPARSIRRRICCAPVSARPGAEGSRHRGAGASARGRTAADGPPVGLGVVLYEESRRGSTG